MEKEIIEISYPVSVIPPEQQRYIVGDNCKAIKPINKNGEMASIEFYEIEQNNGTFVEIRASETICCFKKINSKTDTGPELGF